MTVRGTPGGSPGCGEASPCTVPTGNVLPLLHEIRHALQRWLDGGEEYAIDLRGIPMAPGEEERLLETLGEGEARAELSLNGNSLVTETRFPGVWLISHYNSDDKLVGRFIEVCEMPAILKSQTADAHAGLEYLSNLLGEDNLQ